MNLDVSLHDEVLADELETTARLMVAANESDAPLSTAEVDVILGVRTAVSGAVAGVAGAVIGAVLPLQRAALSTVSY